MKLNWASVSCWEGKTFPSYISLCVSIWLTVPHYFCSFKFVTDDRQKRNSWQFLTSDVDFLSIFLIFVCFAFLIGQKTRIKITLTVSSQWQHGAAAYSYFRIISADWTKTLLATTDVLKFGNVGLCDGEAASSRSQRHTRCHVGFWKLPSQSSAASGA